MENHPARPLEVRRVNTGHNANLHSKIISDRLTTNARRVQHRLATTVIWNTDRMPAEIRTGEDVDDVSGVHEIKLRPNGTQFVVVDFEPGVVDVWHRTETIDYVIVVSGEIDMELDDSTTRLEAGDVVVQRGTYHAWANRGSAPARLMAVLIDAKPLGIGEPKSEG